MKKQYTIAVMMLALVLPMCMISAPAYGQASLEKRVQELEAELGELKALIKESKEAAPAPEGTMTLVGQGKLKVGGDIRWRGLYYDNVWGFDDSTGGDQREVFRFRPRIYFDWQPNDDFEAYVRMTKEWFYGQDNEMPGYNVEGKDVMFDNAWAQMNNIMDTGLTLKIGRQDLIYGEGFVMLDGTPQDGSQTISFDAAKLTYSHDWGTSDLFYAKLHENNFSLADDEDVYGLYNKLKFENFGLEPYLLFRNKNVPSIDLSVQSPPIGDPSPKEETLLLGLRGTTKFDVSDGVSLALAAEGGKEWGEMEIDPITAGAFGLTQDNVDRDAWAGLVHGTLTFEDVAWTPSFKAAFSYMSGDDPNTSDYEGWDDFYAQWPKYSELYVYSLYDGFRELSGNNMNDPDIGVWSNMMIPEFMITVHPTERWTQSIRYLCFLAEEKSGPGTGNERGHNLQWLTKYKFTKNLSTHFLFEWFDPGDFYADDADDALFTRFELMYTF